MEVDATGKLVVCKIADLGKYKYEQGKKKRKKKTIHYGKIKELKLSYRINRHDLETKARRSKEFLAKGYKVRPFIILRGRENIFFEQAKKRIEEFIDLSGGEAESSINRFGNRFSVVMRMSSAQQKDEIKNP